MKTKSGGYTDQTDWHNVVVWQSENLAPYLTKGRTVLVEGRLHSSTWESNGKRQSRVEVIAENVAAEMAYSDMPPLASRVASMGPRPFGRGNARHSLQLLQKEAASMGRDLSISEI